MLDYKKIDFPIMQLYSDDFEKVEPFRFNLKMKSKTAFKFMDPILKMKSIQKQKFPKNDQLTYITTPKKKIL